MMNLFVKTLSLIALYIIASYVAWSMAMPPYFASVFWPAAGVSLGFVFLYGARLLPGVFLGAFLSFLLSPVGNDPNVEGLLAASFLGLGAATQAYLGAYLIKKFVRHNTQFQTLRSIVLFCVLGALSGVVASSIALGLFLQTDRIHIDGALTFWEAWFMGDALGIVLVAPMTVLALSWRDVSLRRFLAIFVPIFFCLIIVIGLFANLRGQDFREKQDRFAGSVEMVKREVFSKFSSYYEAVSAIQSFYKSSENINHQEFSTFVEYTLLQNPDIHALAWVPYVSHKDKERFLQAGRKIYGDNFRIRSVVYKDGSDDIDAAVYMPVLYAEPYEEVKPYIGIDLWSDIQRRKALEHAKDSDAVSASEPISFMNAGDAQGLGFILAAPIYDHYHPYPNIKNTGHAGFKGAVVGAFYYHEAVEDIMNSWRDRGIELRIEVELDGEMSIVYQSQDNNSDKSVVDGFVIDVPYDFAGQKWILHFYMNHVHFNDNLNLSIWYALVIGLVFLSFSSMFLMALTGQSAAMKELVDEKTAELSDKNKFLNVVMDTVPDMIFVKDSEFKIVQANQAFFDKYSPDIREGIIGTTGLEQFPKNERKGYLINDKIALEEGFSETQEFITDYQGEVRTLETRKQRFYDEDNKAFLMGYARDVTDLLSTQQKLETILDTTADGLITIDESGTIETYNKACEDIFGYDAEVAIGKNIDMLIPEYHKSHADFLKHGDHVVSQNRSQLEATRQDLSRFPIDISIAEVKLGSRRIFSAVIRDISEKKKAEELALQITQIFNSAIIEFYIFDAETMEFVFVNNGAINNMGYSEDELLGHRPSDFVEAYADEEFAVMAEKLLSGESERVDFDMRHKRKDGSYYDVAANLQLTTFNGRPAFIASMLDITERNKVTQELKRSNKELESFAYVTSHDLKAPLRHVSMSASFFKDEYADKLDEKSMELLDVMISGANRMQNMIESLLRYSRVGRDGVELKDVDLADVLDVVLENLSDDINDNHANVNVGTLPVVGADRYLMIQLFQNLIQNALKYSKADEAPIITLAYEEEKAFFKFSVADNGIGIDPTYSDKIFQIFQRLHRDNEYNGVGIGLSICQRIIEFHGGSITLDKDYEGGAKFDFTLPKVFY